MQSRIEDLLRRAEQGSKQTQGEALELELESLLRSRFARDLIEPVTKGEFGGDVLHRVLGATGRVCGTIIWESKRTKTWNDNWLTKLWDDRRPRGCGRDAVRTRGVRAPDRRAVPNIGDYPRCRRSPSSASQPTLISAKLVAKRSLAAS
jgi:Uncharacterized protein conserved in bacteria (DUF2130)